MSRMTVYRPESLYLDTGCEDAGVSSCLSCPLAKCVEDMTLEELRAFRRGRRDQEKVRVIEDERLSVEEAAARFGITTRTVWRILERNRAQN